MTITVVTPWYNHPELAPAYWHAIRVGQPDRVVILENGEVTVPGPAEPLKATNVVIVSMNGNAGFNRACNRGLEIAESDTVLFLNNDIAATSADWLDQIRRALRPGRLVGAELRNGQHTMIDGRCYPYLDGWCLAGYRDELLTLGGFDEDYEEPAYYGDNDLSLRARHAGLKLVQAPVGLRHINGVTRRDFDQQTVEITARNRARFVAKARALRAAKVAA